MKRIKFSKSEYVITINLIASLFSFLVFLAGDYYYTDGDNSFLYSYMILFYTCFATISFSIFVPLNGEVFEKRWLTKKEKNISYLVYAIVNVLSFVVKITTVQEEYKQDIWFSLIPFAMISVLWLILKAGGPYSEEYELNDAPDTVCADPFIFESEKATLSAFGVGSSWYTDRKYKRLCKLYIKTAKEFSGKASKREIELRVRNRVMMDGSRVSSFSTITGLVLMGVFFLLLPFYDSFFIMGIASVFQLVGIFTFARNLHDPYTPNESKELARKDTVEKVGKSPVTIHNEHSSTKKDSWTDIRLDVIFNKSGKSFLSLRDVRKLVLKKAGGVDIFWLLMSVGFSAPVIPCLILFIAMDAEWFCYVIFVGVYGVVGGVFTYVFIQTEKGRKKFIKSIPAEIKLSLINCIDVEYDDVSDPETTIYQLFSDRGNYRIYSDAYKKLNKGDKLAFVRIKDYCLAFPLKCWEIEGFSDLQ